MPDDAPRRGPLSGLRHRLKRISGALEDLHPSLSLDEYGEVVSITEGVAQIHGLPGVRSEELVRVGRGQRALALDLREKAVGVAILDQHGELSAGDEAQRTRRVAETPVGDALVGRVVDPLGRPLDDGGPTAAERRLPMERPAPAIMDRAPVTVPLETGIKVIDAMIPIGRGQRELIIGDRQTGKSAVAIDTIINQAGQDVTCIYCAIGQRASSIARAIADLRERGAMEYSTVVATTEADQPGLRHLAPYAAMSMAEHVMEEGGDALVVLDDLTRHARAYRELSLLFRRPPGREAYPGDIFFVHSRLLERSTHLRDEFGGGSLTALPVVQTEAQNISAYIPTNLISITDGQIYLSPKLFQKGVLPAVDVGRSVSRVGGKTQFPAYRDVAGDLRLSYSQFEELESFSRFASRLDEETRRTLEHGRRIREILKQPQYAPMPIPEQIAVLLAVEEGMLDDVPLDAVAPAADRIRRLFRERHGEIAATIREGDELSDDAREKLVETAREAIGESDGGDGARQENVDESQGAP
jgi:F-type H+-transporting ATPase subunit alpha